MDRLLNRLRGRRGRKRAPPQATARADPVCQDSDSDTITTLPANKPVLSIPDGYFRLAGHLGAASGIRDISAAIDAILGNVPPIHLLIALNELALAISRIADGVSSAQDGRNAASALHAAARSIARDNCDVLALGVALASDDSGYSCIDMKHSFAAMATVSLRSRPMVERVVLQLGRHFRGVLRHVTPLSEVRAVARALVLAVHAVAFGVATAPYSPKQPFAEGYKYYVCRLVADVTDSAIVKESGPAMHLQAIHSALVSHADTPGGKGNEEEDDSKVEIAQPSAIVKHGGEAPESPCFTRRG